MEDRHLLAPGRPLRQWAESVRQLVGKGCRITVNGYNREKTYNGKLYREIVATSLSFSC